MTQWDSCITLYVYTTPCRYQIVLQELEIVHSNVLDLFRSCQTRYHNQVPEGLVLRAIEKLTFPAHVTGMGFDSIEVHQSGCHWMGGLSTVRTAPMERIDGNLFQTWDCTTILQSLHHLVSKTTAERSRKEVPEDELEHTPSM